MAAIGHSRSGFVAQDVEIAAKEAGYDFSGVDAPKNENDFYGLRYGDFVVPLVKTVQEQQVIIDKQKQDITDLQKRLRSLEEQVKLLLQPSIDKN
jgi:trimeric autotransporter adhesin